MGANCLTDTDTAVTYYEHIKGQLTRLSFRLGTLVATSVFIPLFVGSFCSGST